MSEFLTSLVLVLLMIPMSMLIVYLFRDLQKRKYKPSRSLEEGSNETIEEDHAILRKDQIDAILSDNCSGEDGENFALTALKRRLHFLESAREKYESDNFVIETKRIGRALRIKWRFKPNTLRRYDIVGFRKTGGFFGDKWDESNNGTLVIQSDKDGESTESLNEGEAFYYTFFLKPWTEGFGSPKRSSLRFQVTISTTDEMDALNVLITRLRQANSGADRRPNISRAIKELGRNVEFENAIAHEEKVWAQQIGASNYSPEEKEEKLERLREMVARIRDDYQT